MDESTVGNPNSPHQTYIFGAVTYKKHIWHFILDLEYIAFKIVHTSSFNYCHKDIQYEIHEGRSQPSIYTTI